jgi:hypothetical protein
MCQKSADLIGSKGLDSAIRLYNIPFIVILHFYLLKEFFKFVVKFSNFNFN